MLQIENWKVYDLKESVIACRNAMRITPAQITDEEFNASMWTSDIPKWHSCVF